MPVDQVQVAFIDSIDVDLFCPREVSSVSPSIKWKGMELDLMNNTLESALTSVTQVYWKQCLITWTVAIYSQPKVIHKHLYVTDPLHGDSEKGTKATQIQSVLLKQIHLPLYLVILFQTSTLFQGQCCYFIYFCKMKTFFPFQI